MPYIESSNVYRLRRFGVISKVRSMILCQKKRTISQKLQDEIKRQSGTSVVLIACRWTTLTFHSPFVRSRRNYLQKIMTIKRRCATVNLGRFFFKHNCQDTNNMPISEINKFLPIRLFYLFSCHFY